MRTKLHKEEIAIGKHTYNVEINHDTNFTPPYLWSVVRKDLTIAWSGREESEDAARAALEDKIVELKGAN
jgi:hypothetical protein